MKDKEPRKKLDYYTNVTASEANAFFMDASESLRKAEENPHGKGRIKRVVRRIRNHLDPAIKQDLVESIEVLLPLGLQEVVQRGEGDVKPHDIAKLEGDILIFMSQFKNTGVERVGVKKR